MARRALTSSDQQPIDRVERARRHRQRGDSRKALLLLREACCLNDEDARVWTLYAMQCWRMGRRDDARQAMRHALWLRERQQDTRRAHVLRGLLSALESASAHWVVRAA